MSPVLDDAYAERLAQRYAGRQQWELPSVYQLATSPERRAQRAWLTAVLEAMPEAVSNRILGRLEKEPNFLATYNELATAAILLGAGYSLAYESEVAGKTPDFLVPAASGRPAMLIEVSTRFRTDAQRRNERRWAELKRRVERIPIPLALFLRGADLGTPDPPESGKAKRVAKALEEALLEGAPPPKMMRVIEDFGFGSSGPSPGAHALLAPPMGSAVYDADLVLEAIAEKVSRYAKVAEREASVLVVVLAAEPNSPLSLDLLRTALGGAQTVAMTIDFFDPGPIRTRPLSMRQEHRPAAFDPVVSAVGWLEPGIDSPGTLTLFPVASARQPVQFQESGTLVVEAVSSAP
jgi:hypothetical protein